MSRTIVRMLKIGQQSQKNLWIWMWMLNKVRPVVEINPDEKAGSPIEAFGDDRGGSMGGLEKSIGAITSIALD